MAGPQQGLLAGEEIAEEAIPTEGEQVEEDMVEEEVSPEARPVYDQAIELAYSEENFPKMVAMFEQGGPEGFPQAMGVAVLGVQQNLEATAQEPINDDILAEVGVKIFEAIAEDMISGGVVQGIDEKIITDALTQAIDMWAKKNPDRFDREAFKAAADEQLASEGVTPTAAPGQAPGQAPTAAPAGAPAAPQQGLLGGV